jgi:hypothetical protein
MRFPCSCCENYHVDRLSRLGGERPALTQMEPRQVPGRCFFFSTHLCAPRGTELHVARLVCTVAVRDVFFWYMQPCYMRVPQIDHQSIFKLSIAIRKGTKTREQGQGNAQGSTG